MDLAEEIWASGFTLMSLKYQHFMTRFDFLFKFILSATSPKKQTVMFDTLADWLWELERTKGSEKYTAVSVNEGYRVCAR